MAPNAEMLRRVSPLPIIEGAGDTSSVQRFVLHSGYALSTGSATNLAPSPESEDQSASSPSSSICFDITETPDSPTPPSHRPPSPMSTFNQELSPLDNDNLCDNTRYSSSPTPSTSSSVSTDSIPDWVSSLPSDFQSDSTATQPSRVTVGHSKNLNTSNTGNTALPFVPQSEIGQYQASPCSDQTMYDTGRHLSSSSADPVDHTSRPRGVAPTDLAFILNSTPVSPDLGGERKKSGVGDVLPVNVPRRRGRSNVDPPPPLSARTITCGISGCGEVMLNERSTVAYHVNHIHTSEGSSNKNKVLCTWTNAWGEDCGTQVASNGLFRHVLNKHTSLLLDECPKCHRYFRRDSLARHMTKCRGSTRNQSRFVNGLAPA